MKKFRGFTLIESLTVIAIIGIMSTALYNMRNIGKDYTDYKKEAVNTIYKEVEQYLKDSQRNKVWTDKNNVAHGLSSFQMKFTDLGLEIGNTYLYCTDATDSDKTVECFENGNVNTDAIGAGFYDSKMLITKTEYTAPKRIKDINKFKFLAYSKGKNGNAISIVNILPNGDIKEGDYIERYISSIDKLKNFDPGGGHTTIPQTNIKERCEKQRTDCTNKIDFDTQSSDFDHTKCCLYVRTNGGISIGDEEDICTQRDYQECMGNNPDAAMYMQLNLCLERNKYYDPRANCQQYQNETTNETITINNEEEENNNNHMFSFIIYADNEGKQCSIPQQVGTSKKGFIWTPIGKITINTITKKASLERCDSISKNCGSNICG